MLDGTKIRELRLAKGMTQAELARATGNYPTHICRIEANRLTTTYTLRTAMLLAQALECSVDELVCRDPIPVIEKEF